MMFKRTAVVATLVFQTFLLLLQKPDRVVALPVFQDYGQPDTFVLQLDLDQRTIVGRTALENESGLDDAEDIYTAGGSMSGDITLQSLSTSEDVFRDFDLYKNVVDFYGDEKFYADKWIQAALDNSNLMLGGWNFDFTALNLEGRSTAVRWGPVVLNVWMYVVSSMEQALNGTQCDTSSQNAAAIQYWDNAFAAYTGSLAESDVPLGGFLLFNFAQEQCVEFGTCKDGQEAPVNSEILHNFVSGKEHLMNGNCAFLKQDIKRIQSLMVVPLIQACLKTAYAMDLADDSRPETQGEAAAYSAAVAPIVSSCSPGSGSIIYKDLSPGNGPSGSYEVVKGAFERTYECLGISSSHVGEITSTNGDASESPEQGDTETAENGGGGGNAGLAVGITIAVLVVAGAGVGMYYYKKRSRKEFDSAKSPEKADETLEEVVEDVQPDDNGIV